jgi:hypothetical protein
MKRFAALSSALAFVLLLGGCPPTPSPQASPSPATPAATGPIWAAQAERCIAKLDEAVAKVEAGDRPAALAAREKAYFEEYENEKYNLEVASKKYLPQELFEARMTNVVIIRELSFGEIKGAISKGAPADKIRSLVDALSVKIRADAAKLDAQNAPPP